MELARTAPKAGTDGVAMEFAVNGYPPGTPYNRPTIEGFKKAAEAIAWQMPE